MANLLSIYWRDPKEDKLEWCLASEAGLLSSGTDSIQTLAREQAQHANEQIELWVSGEDVLYFSVEAPTRRKSLLKSAALYLAEEYLAQDIEQMHMAIGECSEDGLLEVCVMDRECFASMIQRLSEHGLAPDRALPDYLGLAVAPNEATLVLDPVANRGMLRNGNLFASQFTGLSGSPDWLTMALGAHDMSKLDRPTLHLIGDATTEQLQSMQQQLGEWHIQHSQIPKDVDHRLLVGQLKGRSAQSSINLSTGTYRRKRKFSLGFTALAPALRAAVVLAVVLTASVLIKAAGLWLHAYQLQAQSRQIYQAAFLDRALADEEIDSQLKTINMQGSETGIADFLYLFGMLSEAAANLNDPNLDLNTIQYSYSNADLSVSMILSDLGSLERLNQALGEVDLVVNITSAQQREGGFVQAQITVAGG